MKQSAKNNILTALLTCTALAGAPQAQAQITGPVACNGAAEGTMLYNDDLNMMQFCDGTNWIGMGSTGANDNLGAGGTTTGSLFSTNASRTVGRDTNDFIRFDDNAQAFWQINGQWEYQFYPTNFSPYVTSDKDLGTSAKRWKDGWFAGNVTAATISGTTKISYAGVAGAAPTK